MFTEEQKKYLGSAFTSLKCFQDTVEEGDLVPQEVAETLIGFKRKIAIIVQGTDRVVEKRKGFTNYQVTALGRARSEIKNATLNMNSDQIGEMIETYDELIAMSEGLTEMLDNSYKQRKEAKDGHS